MQNLYTIFRIIVYNKIKNLNSGISSYAYTWAIGVPGKEPEVPMTAYDLIDKAISLQVGHVQIADNMPLEGFSEKDLQALLMYAREHGVKIEVGARKLTVDRLSSYLDIATILKSNVLRFIIDGTDYAPHIDEVVKVIKHLAPALENNRIYLALENHDRLLTTAFVEIIEKAGSEWVGICLDTVNSMGAGEGLETVIKRLGPLSVNFHVKEFTVKRIYHMMGFEIEGLPLGEGQLPLKKVLSYLGPKCKTAILEQWVPPVEGDLQATIDKEDQWATQSMKYLKSILAKNPVQEEEK